MFFKKDLDINRFFIAAILFSILAFSACRTAEQADQNEDNLPTDGESYSVPAPTIDLSKPLEISNKPEDVELAKRIEEIIEKSEFSNARWGVFAVSLKDGRVVVARDARKLFNPASIQKILTAVVALDKLGADYRWKTSINAPTTIENGVLNGDLTLYGRGAPDFGGGELNDLVNQLKSKGLTHVTGNIVGNESYFKGEDIGDGWTWNDLQWHYGAEAGALTFQENKAGVYMKDGVAVSSTDYVQVQNDLQPKQAGETKAFGIRRGLADNQIYIWGNDDKAYGKIAVHDTALWAAKTFKDLLEQKGITVDGKAKAVDWKTLERLNVENSVELAFVESAPLSEIVKKMNKRSVNVYAELLLRTLGKNFGDTAPGDNRQLAEVRGDDLAGAEVIKKFLRENKVAVDEIQVHDGSGLSRLDFVSPEAFVRALIFAAQSNFSDVFKDSLPIAATDGTLGGRLGRAKGKILAKTGSITFVNSLAGYAQVSEDEIYAFAIISNNVTRKSDSSRIVDQIAAGLIEKNDKDAKSDKTVSPANENKQANANRPK